MRSDELLSLPDDLSVPEDDGAADHLPGLAVPAPALTSTDGDVVRLDALDGRTVVFAYPRTARPGEEIPGGTEEWNAIPGARGCSMQAHAIAAAHARLRALGVRVYGLSTQTTAYQRELAERLGLPYPALSDAGLELTRALRLPTFEVEGMTLLKRLTLMLRDGRVEHAIYPVFPPDRSADAAAACLEANPEE